MRKLFLAVVLSLSPLLASATTPNTESYDIELSRVLWISAGVVAGVVVADLLLGGMIIAPVASMTDPIMQEARAAGAVFGEQVAAATEIRDSQARAGIIYAILIGSGAVLGGLLVDKLMLGKPQSAVVH